MSDEPKFTQADLDAAIEKAVGPLKTKLDEVMDEAKDAKRKLRAAGEIKPEDLERIETENAALKTDLAKAQKEAKDALKTAETATKALEQESGFTSKLLIDNGLTAALAEAGVKEPGYLKAVKAMMSGSATIATEGEQRIVKIGDKAMADAIKEWATSDEAKAFISAPTNTGGGAGGGSGGGAGGAKTMTRAQFDSLPAGEKLAFGKEGGKVVDKAA